MNPTESDRRTPSRSGGLLLLAGVVLGSGCGGPASVGGKGERRDLAGAVIAAVRVEGAPYEMGWRQGRLLAEPIRERLATPIDPGLNPALAVYAREMRPLLPVVVDEELRGIAAGAGVSADDLFLREVEREGSRWHDDAAPVLGASLVVVAGPPVAVFAAYFGADRIPGGGRFVVLERHPRDGVATIGLAWPGAVGLLAGLSATGLLAAEGEVPGVLPERRSLHGMPFAIGLRVALERARDAHDLFERMPRLIGNRVAVADAQGVRMLGLLHLGAPAPSPSLGWAFAPVGAFTEGDAAASRQDAIVRESLGGPLAGDALGQAVLLAGGPPGAALVTVTMSTGRGLVVQVGATIWAFPLRP